MTEVDTGQAFSPEQPRSRSAAIAHAWHEEAEGFASRSYLPQEPPALDPYRHRKLSKTISAEIPVRLDRFAEWFMNAPLEKLLPGSKSIPAVEKTVPIQGQFPAPGSRRLVCLSDISTALEMVLSDIPREYFSYLVWGYTLKSASALAYGFGEFRMSPSAAGTRLVWTYSFKLNQSHFPGNLGVLGRALFRTSFLNSAYAPFMRSGMDAIKRGAVLAHPAA